MALEIDDINLGGTLSATTVSATTIVFGGQPIQNVFVQNNNTGGYLPISGGTITGDTYFTQGLSSNTFSAGTINSGSTNLYNIFAQIGQSGGQSTYIQPGLNTYTGGTSSAPTVNVSALTINTIIASGSSVFNGGLSANTLSGGTIISGSTNLYSIFQAIGNIDQDPYLNLSGGTVTGNTIFSQGLTASTISAGTFNVNGQLTGNDGAIFSSLSGTNIISGSTNLNVYFGNIFAQLQTKANDSGDTFTGGIIAPSLSATTISGGTIFSGSTNLQNTINNIFAQLQTKANDSGDTFTGGIIAPSLSATTVSGGTVYSGSTDLYGIFMKLGTTVVSGATAINNGLNTYTGGTAANPVINVSALTINTITASGSSVFNGGLSANTLSAGTINSGSTNLYSVFLPKTRASLQSSPADPKTTTSITGVMMGLAGSITPNTTGNIMIVISGDMDNATGDNGCAVQMRTGTGTAPTNGAALTGTARGGLITMNVIASNGTATTRVPFSCNCYLSGLTLGTAIWIDISLAAVVGGTARARNISISAIEI